ncbi:MAG: hypothetical protein HY681_13180 [Chloroflexi bacterium]|nr:hypothetical protein [Chloroflexota bacterium]
MVLEVELRVPAAPSAEIREAILARAPESGEQLCPACGVDRFHLLGALCDPDSWENRALAVSLIRGCRVCREEVTAAIAEARSPLPMSRNGRANVSSPAK